MFFEILSVLLIIIFFILGTKRGFIYEFFCCFKYILLMFLMKYSYEAIRSMFKLDDNISKNKINTFLIVFIILYLILSVTLLFARKFLRSIKLSNYNEFLGGITGIVKATFIIFIIYIVILIGSSYSKRIRKIRDESFLVSQVAEYTRDYSQGFPEFIQENINSYRKEIKEKEIEKKVLKTLKNKYIYSSLILPSIFGISIFTFILMLNVVMEVMERLFASDLPFMSIIDYFFYAVPGILVQTIPMGAFLGVMLVYGGLSETNELIAMEGSGIGLFRIIRPAFTFGLILTFIGIGLEIYVNPKALENINAQTQVVLATKPSSLTEEKIFLTNPESGFGFYIDEVDNEKANAKNFLILNKQGDNPYPVIFLAENARFDPGVIVLKNVKGYSFDKEGNSQVAAEYKEQEIPISTFFKNKNKEYKKSRSEMNIKELKQFHDQNIKIPEMKEAALKSLIEIYQRLIGPLASTLLCWLGVLLSVGHRRSGRGISFGISLIVIFAYIAIVNYAKIMVLKNNVPANIAMWIPNTILLILCIYFSIKKYRRN